eukprot:GHVT01005684.1.p2 GENE.GHVT01005684.1~~GHVT01005684.1.p2  ORF type:complete len:112 (-),score=11.95 GHVT01005684.1:3002-3337(-)
MIDVTLQKNHLHTWQEKMVVYFIFGERIRMYENHQRTRSRTSPQSFTATSPILNSTSSSILQLPLQLPALSIATSFSVLAGAPSTLLPFPYQVRHVLLPVRLAAPSFAPSQ